MPTLRLYTLLVAGAACLTLTACGGDDDSPPQAVAPSQTEAATTAETAPAQTPTTTAPDAPTGDKDSTGDAGDPSDTADSGAASPAETPTSPPAADGNDGPSGNQPSRPSTSKGSGASSSKKGSSGSAAETAKIHAALVGLQEAFAARDGKKACSYLIGVPEKADPMRQGGMSCESLSQGARTTLSEENRKIAATAKVTINGRDATAELGPGVPLQLRKVDGRWRVDYTELARPAAGSR